MDTGKVKHSGVSSKIRNLVDLYPWTRNTGTGITVYL